LPPIDPAFVVIDLHQPPPMLVPSLETAAGALALLLFLFLQVQRRADRHAPAADGAVDSGAAGVEGVVATEAAASAESPPTQAPRRLRGLMLLNLPADAGVEFIENAPPLGGRADVLRKLATALPGIRADEDGRCAFIGPDYSVTISIGSSEPIATAVVDAQGDGGTVAIQSILRATGWRAFAARRGTFIDPDHLDEVMEPAP
jgi:hypothetical protein